MIAHRDTIRALEPNGSNGSAKGGSIQVNLSSASLPQDPDSKKPMRLNDLNRTATCSFDVTPWFKKYHGLVLAVVQRYIYKKNNLHDVAADVWMKLCLCGNRYDPKLGSETTFICTIARNTAVDSNRSQNQRRTLSLGCWHPDDRSASPMACNTGHRDVEIKEAAPLVLMTIVNRLTPKEREVFFPIVVYGRSFKSTAVELGIPVGTVKSRYHWAMKKVRQVAEERPDLTSP